MVAYKGKSDNRGWVPAVIVVVCVFAVAGYMAWRAMHPGAVSQVPASAATSGAAKPAAAASTHYPIAQAEVPASASTAPLPAPDGSDAGVRSALLGLGGDRLKELLLSQQIITHVVTTVDALPRHELGSASILPLRTPQGAFLANETQGIVTADARNIDRYAPYMAVMRRVDSRALVAWYAHDYPLFQQAYRELGYPKGYFNDRLIAAIDDMLAAPSPSQPSALQLVNGRYTYVDPALESLSVGQKLMLRLGPANEAEFKAKLRVIRSLLTARPLSGTQAK